VESVNGAFARHFFKRVAGVESMSHSHPFRESVAITPPPAHDPPADDIEALRGALVYAFNNGLPALHHLERTTWPVLNAANAWGAHFFRCFFCRIGDNRIEDHFCETGRELIVAMLDELEGRP